jgi:hypothetical protein
MEDDSLPPLFPEQQPADIRVSRTSEQLNAAALFAAENLDAFDGILAEYVAAGAMSEEVANQERANYVTSAGRLLMELENGRPSDPDLEQKAHIDELETAMGALALFERASQLAVESGRMTEEELTARRRRFAELRDRLTGSGEAGE